MSAPRGSYSSSPGGPRVSVYGQDLGNNFAQAAYDPRSIAFVPDARNTYHDQRSIASAPVPDTRDMYHARTSMVSAHDALFGAPAGALQRRQQQQQQSLQMGSSGLGTDASNDVQNADFDNAAAEKEEVEDDEEVYLTDAYRVWECHYLKRLAKRVHKMVCAELDSSEEALLMVFLTHDPNLEGTLSGEGASKLLEALRVAAAPGAVDVAGPDGPADRNGFISSVALLRWYSGRAGQEYRDASTGFGMASFFGGAVGSSTQNDSRVDALDWASLRRNILGYRRLLLEVRQLREERVLEQPREVEGSTSLEAAMPLYYAALANEFEGDSEHLFELFCDVDETGNMLLERKEVLALLRLLDTSASETDLRRYLQEINLTDGPLSFASLVDWWDQACSVSNSLVAEKGTMLTASVKARSAGKRFSSLLFSQTAAQRRWAEALEGGRLEALRLAYERTLSEVREYKMERDLRAVEQECAAL